MSAPKLLHERRFRPSITSVKISEDARRQMYALGISTADTDQKAFSNLKEIYKCLTSGQPIPEKFYRKGIDADTDSALKDYGLIHLHYDSNDDDKLLFVQQFESFIFFVTLSDHSEFRYPPGMELHHSFQAEVAKILDEYSRSKALLERTRVRREKLTLPDPPKQS